jgi:ferredoxin
MRVLVDRDLCIGAGQCVRAAAEVFAQDASTGLVILLKESPDPLLRRAVEEAVDHCPVRAITIEDKGE